MLIGLIFIVAIGLGALAIMMPKEEFDQLNPLAKSEERYVKIEGKGTLVERRYAYELPTYNAEGKKLVMKFTAADQLKQGAYLKLSTKGNYTESWAEVDEKQVPEDTLLHLT